MSDKQRHTILFFGSFFCAILVCFLLVWIQIVRIQTVERAEWEEWSKGQVVENDTIPAERGNILDRNGRLLACSSPTYTIRFDGRVEPLHSGKDTLFRRHIDTFAAELEQIVGQRTAAEYKEILTKAHRDSVLVKLTTQTITYTQMTRLRETYFVKLGKNTSGIIFESRPTRIRQFNKLAEHTIGNISAQSGHGRIGLEAAFDRELSGTPGLADRIRSGGESVYKPIREPIPGMDIVTTLDINLQDIVESRLESLLRHNDGERGCAILMEVHTGKIVALANLERGKRDQDDYFESDDIALRRFEPGSTFKTIALTAALDEGRMRFSDTVSVTKKPWVYNKLTHKDAHKIDTILTARSAIAASSNIALAKYIVRAYNGEAAPFVKRVKEFGFENLSLREIPGEKALLLVPDRSDRATIAKMGYGYYVELTPIQTVSFYNAIANGGRLLEPYLVEEVRHHGETIRRFGPKVLNERIASRKTLDSIRVALHDVVWDNHLGTASRNYFGPKAQSHLVHIAGKTGTAQMREHKYHEDYHRITFVGYFPEEDPLYTCLVYIEDSKVDRNKYYDSGRDCGGAVRDIAERVIATTCAYHIVNGKKVFVKNQ